MPERKKRDVAALKMEHAELAARIERTFIDGYDKLVVRGEVDDAVQGLKVLLSQAAAAIDKAEEAAEAAKAVRVAIIRCQIAVGMTMEDIGAVHGLSRQRVGQLLQQFQDPSALNDRAPG